MLQLQLPDDFSRELKKTIGEAYKSAIDQSRKDVGINVDYLTKQQVMKLFDVGNTTLMNEWVPKGLSHFRIAGKIYFKKKDINNFIEQHKI